MQCDFERCGNNASGDGNTSWIQSIKSNHFLMSPKLVRRKLELKKFHHSQKVRLYELNMKCSLYKVSKDKNNWKIYSIQSTENNAAFKTSFLQKISIIVLFTLQKLDDS